MNALERDLIRRARDARTRQLLADDPSPRCAGCGVFQDEKTPGCSTCWNRHRQWKARAEVRAGTYAGPHGTRGYSVGCHCDVCVTTGRAQRRNRRHASQYA